MGTFGGRLKEFRVYKNLSQNDFADKCGVSQANVTQWETDRNKPSGKIIGIQKAFPDLNIDWLETGYGEMILSKPFMVIQNDKPMHVSEPQATYLMGSDRKIMELQEKIIELQQKLLEAKESKKS